MPSTTVLRQLTCVRSQGASHVTPSGLGIPCCTLNGANGVPLSSPSPTISEVVMGVHSGGVIILERMPGPA